MMIIDKPKRKVDAIRGRISPMSLDSLDRIRRAFAEVRKKFDMVISDRGLSTSRSLLKFFFVDVAVSAVIYREPLRSRWARALDMIREQYGLEIEWDEREIAERGKREHKPLRPEMIHNWRNEYIDDPFVEGPSFRVDILGRTFHEAYDPPKSGKGEDVHGTPPKRNDFRYRALGAGFTVGDALKLKDIQKRVDFDVIDVASKFIQFSPTKYDIEKIIETLGSSKEGPTPPPKSSEGTLKKVRIGGKEFKVTGDTKRLRGYSFNGSADYLQYDFAEAKKGFTDACAAGEDWARAVKETSVFHPGPGENLVSIDPAWKTELEEYEGDLTTLTRISTETSEYIKNHASETFEINEKRYSLYTLIEYNDYAEIELREVIPVPPIS